MTFDKSWVVYGPQGCGKTENAQVIADYLKLKTVCDEWDGKKKTFTQTNTLHLTDKLPAWWPECNRRAISYNKIMGYVRQRQTARR